MEMDKYIFYDLQMSDMRYGIWYMVYGMIIPDLPIKEQ